MDRAAAEESGIERALLSTWQLLRNHPRLKGLMVSGDPGNEGGVSICASGRIAITLPYYHRIQDARTALECFSASLGVCGEEATINSPRHLFPLLTAHGTLSGAPVTVYAWKYPSPHRFRTA